jgi:hypothetical protein
MTNEMWRQGISLIGAAIGLWAFIMLQLERKGWGPKDAKYLFTCIFAGSFLSWAAILDRNVGFIILNIVFTLFAIRGIGQRIWNGIWRNK